MQWNSFSIYLDKYHMYYSVSLFVENQNDCTWVKIGPGHPLSIGQTLGRPFIGLTLGHPFIIGQTLGHPFIMSDIGTSIYYV